MNNIFEISGDEIKRILSLHEESTKQQYLNVLNEQSKDTYTTTQDHKEGGYIIPKGTIFSHTNKEGVLYANVKYNGMIFTIYYNCVKWFYVVKGKDDKYYDKGLSNELSNFCSKSNNKVSISGSYYLGLKEGVPMFSIPSKTLFTKNSTGASFVSSSVNQKTQTMISGVSIPVTYKSQFNCDKSNFLIEGKYYIELNGKKLTTSLFNKFCKGQNQTTPNQQTPQQTTTTTTKSPVQQKPVTRQTPQQFAQQVKTYNTQIQTSLGSQKPTGQITDADLDNILTKLG